MQNSWAHFTSFYTYTSNISYFVYLRKKWIFSPCNYGCERNEHSTRGNQTDSLETFTFLLLLLLLLLLLFFVRIKFPWVWVCHLVFFWPNCFFPMCLQFRINVTEERNLLLRPEFVFASFLPCNENQENMIVNLYF